MSSDNATERLRELLDERGVEWWYGIGEKSTVFDGKYGVRYEVDGTLGLLFIRSALSVTPEQAIAATLGNERIAFLEEKVKRQGEYIDKLTKEKKALFAQNCESATRHAGQIDAMQKKLDAATLGREQQSDPVWEQWYEGLRHDEIKTIGDAVEQLMYESIKNGGDMGPNGNTYGGIDEGEVVTLGFINDWIEKFEATLGRGTCHDVYPNATYCFTCSECGHVRRFIQGWNNVTNSSQDEFNFCPNCGRKVVGPTTNDADTEVDANGMDTAGRGVCDCVSADVPATGRPDDSGDCADNQGQVLTPITQELNERARKLGIEVDA